MTQPEVPPPDWIINVPSTPAVHDEPPPAYGWEGISDTALQGIRKNLIEAIVGLIGQLPDIALNLIRQLITMVDNAEDLIFEIINMVLGWITQAPELIITVIETALAWLIEIPELFVSVVNAVVGIITDIPEIISTIIQSVLQWITSIPDLILTVIDTFLSWIGDDSDLIITVVEAGLQWLIDVPDMVTSIVEAFLEFITSIPDVTESILNAFESWIDSIPEFITDLVGAFFGWITEVPQLVISVVERILEWFTSDDNLVELVVSTWLTFITEIPNLIGLLISTWITWIIESPGMVLDFITRALLPFGLLGPNSPLNAFNIFGLLNAFNIPLLNIGHLTNAPGPNLLVAPGFDDDQLLVNGWAWDNTQGKTTNGSAQATAAGVKRELKSNAVPVAPGQNLNVGVWLRWTGLVYTGAPIVIRVVRYLAGVEVGVTDIASPPSPATNQSSWTQFTGTYAVPAGCDSVTLNFVVTSGATAGRVWFDDATLSKTGTSLPQSWVTGLLDSLGGLGDFIQGLLDTLIGIIRGIPLVGGVLGDLLESFTGQTHTIVSTAATTDQILAALGPGNPDADDFERTSTTTLGPKWKVYQTFSGATPVVATPNGHDAAFTAPGFSTAEFIALSEVLAAGNSQQAATVLASAPGYAGDIPFGPPQVYAATDLWICCENTFTTWAGRTGLRARIDAGKSIRLSWWQAGVETAVLYTGTFGVSPVAGASFSLEQNVGGIMRRRVAKLNGTPIMDTIESGTVSQFGPNYLRRAFGGKLDHTTFNPAVCATYKQWTAQG